MKKLTLFLLVVASLVPAMAFAADANFQVLLTPPSSDLSVSYLSYIFGVVDGVLHGTGSQVMGQMFGVFNSSLLAVGGAVLMYILVVSVLKTAHEGEVMGKNWSSIWIPVRSVIGVGLLVPKASGYSAIQILMMWIVLQGVGAADSVWNRVIDYVKAGGALVQQSDTTSNSLPGDVRALSANVFKSLVCMYSLQSAMNDLGNKPGSKAPRNIVLLNTVAPVENGKISPQGAWLLDFPNTVNGYPDSGGICGTLSWSKMQTQGDERAQDLALTQLILDLAPAAQAVVNNAKIQPSTARLPLQSLLSNNAILTPAFTYMTLMKNVGAPQRTNAAEFDTMKNRGWISAGSYYTVFANANSTIKAAPLSNVPVMTPPANSLSTALTKANASTNLAGVTSLFSPLVQAIDSDALDKYTNAASSSNAIGGVSAASGTSCDGSLSTNIKSIGGISQVICTLRNYTASDQISNTDPILKLSMLGVELINMSMSLWLVLMTVGAGAAALTGAIPFLTVSLAPVVIATWFAPMLTAILMAFMAPSAVLAFYVPMIPFIIFFFAALGWFTAVLESMIAAPLVALALIHPEGQSEVFGRAEQAFLIVLNLFLRPTLMIFGFVAGVIFSYVGLWLMNSGLNGAITSGIFNMTAGSMADIVAGVAVIAIYALLTTGLISQSFGLISVVPDKVLRWIGHNAEQFGSGTGAGGGAEDIKGGMSGVGSAAGDVSSRGASGMADVYGKKRAEVREEQNKPKDPSSIQQKK